jgi:nucleoside-diphosphate-sugar epimerase
MSSADAIVVVGAAGFIGRALARQLAAAGQKVVAAVRHPVALGDGITVAALGEIGAATDWAPLFAGARAVVHLASRAHQPLGIAPQHWIDEEVAAGAALARAAAAARLERVVLLSSIKVLGEGTADRAYRAGQSPAPEDEYGLAKWSLETAMETALRDGPTLTVLRPPLVFGPGVKANFLALLRLVDRGLPLPLAAVKNQRSLVSLDNLVDLIATVLDHPDAGGTFLVRDDEEISTPELVRRIAHALGRPARLFPCPPAVLRGAARLAGRGDAIEKLLGSLRIDDSATRHRFAWQPRVAFDDALAATCRWYRERDAAERGTAASAS